MLGHQDLQADTASQRQRSEQEVRIDLAMAYRILHHCKLDDLTYTHITSRACDDPEAFYIFPFGMLFQEVRASDLLKVSFGGEVLEGASADYNPTGFAIHGSIYQARPEIMSIIHAHSAESIAVSVDPR